MKVFFRADASLQMGSGHVMRCLTLADALKALAAECQFICREHQGNLIEFIRNKGYTTHALCGAGGDTIPTHSAGGDDLSHAPWLGATQHQDAAECAAILGKSNADWLVVDHYALDARWESALKQYHRKLMVLDDLADRPHQCDLLLDQTFGRNPADYKPWVPPHCNILCGSQYALLRPEFAALRPYSLQRRKNPSLEHLLITMGGVDKDNATGQVLHALKSSELPSHSHITVVMGAAAPWLAEVRLQAAQMPWPTTVRAGVSDMAQLMADSDLAIGAAGATSWERCCLGLPTIMVVLAANQRGVARGLEQAGAVRVLQSAEDIGNGLAPLMNSLVSSVALRTCMSETAAGLADGSGVATAIKQLEL